MKKQSFERQLNIDFNDLVLVTDPPPGPAETWLGQEDGHYPEAKFRAMIARAGEAGYARINFRVDCIGKVDMRSTVKEWSDHDPAKLRTLEAYDPFDVALDEARRHGMSCWAWLTPLDDAGPIESPVIEDHREFAGKFQSAFSREHPEYQLLSRDGSDCLWGVYCFGHPEVRAYFRSHLAEVAARGPDGVFLSNRTHSNLDAHKRREYGFNAPLIEAYRQRHGADPTEASAFDLERFSRILGEFYTEFLRESGQIVRDAGSRIAAAASWTRQGRIASRLGSLDRSFFDWMTWVDEGIVDELVIGGDLATGGDPEHILGYLETQADSANPAWFRERSSREVPICRWLTLWGWGWSQKEDLTDQPNAMFKESVVRKMLDRCRESGLDGVLMHEAVNLATHDLWDL